MQKDLIQFIFLVLIVSACNSKDAKQVTIPLGQWRGQLYMQGKELPFHLISKRSDSGDINFIIKNGEEEIVLEKFDIKGDSLILPMHIFDTKIVARIAENELKGYWTKNYYEDYTLPFKAVYNEEKRFDKADKPIDYDFSGRWETQFYNEETDYPAIGEFKQTGDQISGTFLTETGDYRFLEGILTERGFRLSTFDGEHAYLFEAQLTEDDTLKGEYWSGKTGYYQWKAYRNEKATLADADSLTLATDRSKPVSIAYPNEKGDTIRLSDPKFREKVVILQILGSWCANCMDETAFLSKWYEENKHRDIEIIGLAFERKGEFDYGASRIKIMKDRYDIGYEILFAGKNDQETRNKVLYMTTDLVSFPTTIFLDKKGKIQKIHTGFSGPSTGEHYEEFVKEFNETVDQLLQE